MDQVISDARRLDGLEDLGPADVREPLGALLESYAAAPLNDLGIHILRSGVVHSLRMRLRAHAWLDRHPEIDAETIDAPIVVVGMMRSGTTLAQRLLAADPQLHCAYGWEIGEVAPPLDIDWSTEVDQRIGGAEEREAQSRAFVPDLFAIHPMYAREAEEEIMFLADAFLSHVPEASADVPDYRRWIDAQSFAPAYDYLHHMLQHLQWQKRQRGKPARRWVLKTPAHLGYLDELLRVFPDAHIVHLHRDPVATVASGASLNTTLWRMHSNDVDPHRVGAQWIERMGWTNDRALAVRDRWPDDAARVTDIDFAQLVADPIAQMATVYGNAGLPFSTTSERAMDEWMRARPDSGGQRPSYTPEDFGLSPEQIRDRFAISIERFPSI